MVIADFVHAAWLALAIVLEIAANIFLKYSDGFKRPLHGLLSLCCILLAFSALAQCGKRYRSVDCLCGLGWFWNYRDCHDRLGIVRSTAES